ncbi:MAG: hypothetical protein RIK87_10760 [Fuerstiella sp.]
MLKEESLRDLITTDEIGNLDKVLLCLSVQHDDPKQVKEVSALAFNNGFRRIKKLNVSDLLRRSKGLAVRVDTGWTLSSEGIKHVQQIAGPLMNSPIPKVASSLRTLLPNIARQQTADFVEEAISCFETRQYRAAIVLSWVGAVAVLYDHVVNNHLAQFNADATTRFAASRFPWVPAKNADGLSRMKEADFLIVLEKTNVIGKNVKQQLENALKLRNSCGHPNSYKLGEHKVSAHIEDLILNVYARFA